MLPFRQFPRTSAPFIAVAAHYIRTLLRFAVYYVVSHICTDLALLSLTTHSPCLCWFASVLAICCYYDLVTGTSTFPHLRSAPICHQLPHFKLISAVTDSRLVDDRHGYRLALIPTLDLRCSWFLPFWFGLHVNKCDRHGYQFAL